MSFWSNACSAAELRPLTTLIIELYASSGVLVSLFLTILNALAFSYVCIIMFVFAMYFIYSFIRFLLSWLALSPTALLFTDGEVGVVMKKQAVGGFMAGTRRVLAQAAQLELLRMPLESAISLQSTCQAH